MISAQPWASYRRVTMQTAPPGQLVVMLYDGAIRFLERANVGFQHEDPLEFNATINNNVLRAQEIIHELNNSLDMQQGGELANTLRSLYNYMDRRLTESNMHKTADGIHETIRRLTVLRDAWREMLNQQGAPVPAEQQQASPLYATV